MNNFLSLDQVKDLLMKNVTPDFEAMKSDEMLSTLLASVDSLKEEPLDKRTLYTGRDISDVRDYLVNKVIELTDKWSDFNESDTGMVLIELIAGLADMLGFYLDKQTLECYITSVKQRKNGVGILSLINYKLHMTNSCLTTGRFVLPEIYDMDIEIPRYTQLSAVLADKSEVKYATLYDTMIPSGTDAIEVPLIQGEVNTSYVPISDLRNNQKIQLLAENIAQGSMIVTIDGKEWTEVPDVLIDDVPGRKYSLYEDKLCQPIILFHNSYKDYLPSDDSMKAEFKFLTSLGPDGKIRAGMITRIDSQIYAGKEDISSAIEATNIEASSGGSERETLDHARVQAPKTLSMLGKAITLDDYYNMAMDRPGVLKCSALDWSVENGRYVSVPYQVDLYIVPTDKENCSEEQINSIKDYFGDNRMVSSMTLNVFSADYVTVDISAKVYAVINESKKEALRSMIESQIRNHFRAENMDFGSGIQPSNIITLIENTSEAIDYVELEEPTGSTKYNLTQFPQLGELNIEIIRNSVRFSQAERIDSPN